MRVTAIIAAAGRGQRFGDARPKQLLSIGGRPILERSVTAFVEHPSIHDLIVALPMELAGSPPAYLNNAAKPLRVVAGGVRRQDSVINAFREVPEGSEVIVIHDAVRPFASADLIARTIAAATESGAALAALQARDTVKRAQPRSSDARPGQAEGWMVAGTIPRELVFLAQTPQAFRREVLRDALALNVEATDEAALVEHAGHRVRLVEGEASNIKITMPEDLAIAETIARRIDGPGAAARAEAARVGTGYDLHRLVEGRPLVLAGVTIPFERGLVGYSDADAVCHAVIDALLGAANAGDIGRHFPDSEPQWQGASSLELLRRAAEIVRQRGFAVVNIDVIVVAERPKLAPYIGRMAAKLANALGASPESVSIKAKTNEGIDAIGRGEAIAVHAIALLTAIAG
jgi:2-C-methyl-D-erythritol 4-phosphate cytidylyltransferase / 2-C-methyl-D-erythritol 2,4-cyclodiphosphate synthase